MVAFLGAAGAVASAARRIPARRVDARRRSEAGAGTEGAVAGLLVVMCAVTFVIWLSNPFAALLVVPALHLWMWAISPDLRLPRAVRALLIAVGVAPVALVVVYYANGLGYGPLGLVWQAALLLAGHGVSLVAALEWCLLLGCSGSLCTRAGWRSAEAPKGSFTPSMPTRTRPSSTGTSTRLPRR